jgi:L-lysine 6-transaminase
MTALAELLTESDMEPQDAGQVHEVLARSILADGFDLVLDLKRSSGAYLVDARDGRSYLDMFTFFASSALGMNHPALAGDDEFRAELTDAALNKPSASSRLSHACSATRCCRTCSSSTAARSRWRTR